MKTTKIYATTGTLAVAASVIVALYIINQASPTIDRPFLEAVKERDRAIAAEKRAKREGTKQEQSDASSRLWRAEHEVIWIARQLHGVTNSIVRKWFADEVEEINRFDELKNLSEKEQLEHAKKEIIEQRTLLYGDTPEEAEEYAERRINSFLFKYTLNYPGKLSRAKDDLLESIDRTKHRW